MNFSAFFCTFSANYCWTPAKGNTFRIFAASLLCVCYLASVTSSPVTCTKMLMVGWDLSGQLGPVTGAGVLFLAWSPVWIWTCPADYSALDQMVLMIQRWCHNETVWDALNKLSGLIFSLTHVLHCALQMYCCILIFPSGQKINITEFCKDADNPRLMLPCPGEPTWDLRYLFFPFFQQRLLSSPN